jgi:uncharacterized membrane protein
MRFFQLNIDKLKAERLFIILASFFGLIILFITPPFQTPDEINHFYRAYQISEGQFIAIKQDNRIGGYMPVSLIKITEPFYALSWNMHAKTSYQTIANQSGIPLDPHRKTFVDFPNTGMYSPVSYLPQSISIFALRKFNLPPLYILYGARIFTLLFWLLSIFWAIKIIPFYKWFFTFIALLPMSLFINGSLSADVVTNLLSFILIAYLLRLAYLEQVVTIRKFVIICALTILLALAKVVYMPVVGLILLVGKEEFGSKKRYYTLLAVFFVISLSAALFWSHIMNNLYLPYNLYNEQFRDNATLIKCANMHEQMQYIITHGLYLWHVFINSMIQSFDMYFQGYIGTFGWLETKLPLWFIYSSYIIIAIIALSDKNKNLSLKPFHKLIIFGCLIITIFLILLSQHLTWDCVGGDIISTIQGRYFIPVFPLLFLLLYNTKINFVKNIAPIVIIFSFFSLSFTVRTLYKRYYVVPAFDSVNIKCNAEIISNDNRFLTNLPDVTLENANAQSKEKAKSGKYSAKLTPKSQFAYTYRLYNCENGDVINVDVWRFGKDGGIVVSGDAGDFYISKSDPVEKDSLGWKHLQLKCTLPKGFKEVGIYLYYVGKDSSYFDDISISYNKFK